MVQIWDKRFAKIVQSCMAYHPRRISVAGEMILSLFDESFGHTPSVKDFVMIRQRRVGMHGLRTDVSDIRAIAPTCIREVSLSYQVVFHSPSATPWWVS
jgi:hypothetical protein